MGYAQFLRDYALGRRSKLGGQHGSGITAQVNAGLVAGSVVWSLRYPEAATKTLVITRLVPRLGCTVAFTATGIVIGRGLSLVRASAPAGTSDPSGGTAFGLGYADSTSLETALVGRASSGAALTTTGFVKETNPQRRFLLSGGTANSNVNLSGSGPQDFNWEGQEPIYLSPGQALFWQANIDFDAAGNWFFECGVDAFEAP